MLNFFKRKTIKCKAEKGSNFGQPRLADATDSIQRLVSELP